MKLCSNFRSQLQILVGGGFKLTPDPAFSSTCLSPNIVENMCNYFTSFSFSCIPEHSWGQWRRLHRVGGARAPTFTDGWARASPWVEEQQTKADQTVLTVTKLLTKRLTVLVEAKKVEGHNHKNSFRRHWPGNFHLQTYSPSTLAYQCQSGDAIWRVEWNKVTCVEVLVMSVILLPDKLLVLT